MVPHWHCIGALLLLPWRGARLVPALLLVWCVVVLLLDYCYSAATLLGFLLVVCCTACELVMRIRVAIVSTGVGQ